MKTWKIYKHTLLVGEHAGWSYIGLTSQKLERRWRNGLGYKNDILFWNAIKKYGWESFSHDILETNIKTLAEANSREKYWIAYYHTWVQDTKCHGYNITPGGEGTIGYKFTEAQKLKLSQSKKGKPNFKLREWTRTAEHRANISKALTGRKQPKDVVDKRVKANTGKKRNSLQKQKIGIANGQTIICIETGQQFYSISEAARQTGINRRHLMEIIKTGRPCNARILTKYNTELKNKLIKYNGTHFKII